MIGRESNGMRCNRGPSIGVVWSRLLAFVAGTITRSAAPVGGLFPRGVYMSWEATAFVNNLRSGVTRSEKFLLLILSNYHNTEKQAAWPSLSTISRDSLLSVRQVSRMVNRLQAKNVLTITPDGARGQNIYRFVGLDVEMTIDNLSIVPAVPTIDNSAPTIDISRTTIDILEPTIDIAMSTNPTVEPTVEPILEPIAGAKRAKRRAVATKKVQRSGHETWASPWVQTFGDAYELVYEKPYESHRGDYSQLRKLTLLPDKTGQPWLTLERFQQGVAHYFSSDLGNHTLADLAVRFGSFYRSALDRYGKPVIAPVSVNGTRTKRETENERNRRENAEYLAALDRAAAGADLEAPASITGNSRTVIDDERRGSGLDGKLLEPRFG